MIAEETTIATFLPLALTQNVVSSIQEQGVPGLVANSHILKMTDNITMLIHMLQTMKQLEKSMQTTAEEKQTKVF